MEKKIDCNLQEKRRFINKKKDFNTEEVKEILKQEFSCRDISIGYCGEIYISARNFENSWETKSFKVSVTNDDIVLTMPYEYRKKMCSMNKLVKTLKLIL